MTESPKYTHPETHDISPAPEVRRSIRKEPPIPAKPSIKSELLQPKSLNVQTGTRQQEMSYTRPVVQARLSPSEGISRDEVLRMNRHQAAGLRQEWQARPHSHAVSMPSHLICSLALTYLNFHPFEVVSRYRDPQLQVGENCSYLFHLRPNISKSICFSTHPDNSDLFG